MPGLSLPSPLKRLSHFERLTLALMLFLAVLAGIVLWSGDRTVVRVTQFSWEGEKIGVQDRQFHLRFNRRVEKDSVEQNLRLEPPLPGTLSWSGRDLFYTLTELPIYGTSYQLKLEGGKRAGGKQEIETFFSLFNTRDRAFAYIGIEEGERGRLVLFNITQQKKTILTPADLIVTDYRIYPQGDKIVFSAYEPTSRQEGTSWQQIYSVTTGLNFPGGEGGGAAGKLQILLDAKDYENRQFDLSHNGKTLLVERENRRNPADAGLWALSEGQSPRPLGIPSGEFALAPDGKSVAVSQRGGISVIPLAADVGGPQFLAGFEKSLGFSADGSQQLVLRDNRDYTRSLFAIEQDGEARELFKTANPIASCEFEPRQKHLLYCLKTDWVEAEAGQYRQEPYLAAIDLQTGKDIPLLTLPNYQDVQMSMSADGVALLFDQVAAVPAGATQSLITGTGKAISDGRLWLLTLPELEGGKATAEILPEQLNPGFKPCWLP